MSEPTPIEVMYCYRHPQRQTLLRCNRCERPICSECSILTPTGYRCPECVRGQQRTFDTSRSWDYVIAVVIAGVLSFLGSLLASVLGFFTIFIAPVVGYLIAEAIRKSVQRRRSRLLFQLSAGAAALGALPLLLVAVISLLIGIGSQGGGLSGLAGLGGVLSLVWHGLYAFLVVSTTYYRLSGIQL